MARIGVVFHSSTGYTRLLAAAVAQGAAEADDAEVVSLEIQGAVSAQTKAFMDACLSRWYARAWSGKVGAAFTVSSTPSGDKLNALHDLFVFAMQMGMVWVGQDESPISGSGSNRLGIYVGAAAQPDYQAEPAALMPGDAEGGRLLGARVASLADRLAT